MIASELRIGNLYWYQCEDKDDERQRWLELSAIEVGDLRWLTLSPNDPNFIPIELTYELFDKMNFAKDPSGTHWCDFITFYIDFLVTKDGVFPEYCQYAELSSEHSQFVWLKKLKYLHELQNFWFVLTGEELVINKNAFL